MQELDILRRGDNMEKDTKPLLIIPAIGMLLMVLIDKIFF